MGHWQVVGNTGDEVKLRLRVAEGNITVGVSDAGGTRTFRSLDGASRKSYFVTGSWANFGFSPMEPDPDGNPDVHRFRFRMSHEDAESFQIVVDEDLDQAIYPEMHLANQELSVAQGPDNKGKGMFWAITEHPFAEIEIVLDFSQADRRRLVTWLVDVPKA